ncbi:hypothetical protein Bhyg_07800, partial [Pseudolycoriella hygida]
MQETITRANNKTTSVDKLSVPTDTKKPKVFHVEETATGSACKSSDSTQTSNVERVTKNRTAHTGSVFNRPKSGRPRTATNEENEVLVLGSVFNKRQQSLREIANETGNSMASVWRILHRHKFHPYGVKLTQELTESDYGKRLDFCEFMERKVRDSNFLKTVCFSDESTFHLTGYVNRHNCRYWCQENPNEYLEAHTQRPKKENVWFGILGNEVIGPFFIDGNLDGP